MPTLEQNQQQMRARFHELDAQVKAIEADIAQLDAQLNQVVLDMVPMLELKKSLGAQKKKIIADTQLHDLAAERSAVSRYLSGKTGTKDNH